ncbi:MAG: protein kinase [Planctomycetota bacterium]
MSDDLSSTASTLDGGPGDGSAGPRGAELAPGQRLGEWILEEPLGTGAFAAVWRARHNALAERVAVKVPHDPAFSGRLRREAALLERVTGEHLVSVKGLDPEHEPPYLVMELVEGGTLRDRLDREGRLSPAEARRLLIEVAEGIETAHAAGVVHRDLKPANVLLDGAGRAYVADFGLGRLQEAATQELLASGSLRTQEGSIVGTLRYMAPEQRDPHGEVDHRADLYAFGVILFELLTGEVPCGGEVPTDVDPSLDARWDPLYRGLCARKETRIASATEALARLRAIDPAPQGPDPVAAGAARCVAVPAGLFWRAVAGSIDLLPFLLLLLGPLRMGRGAPAIAAFFLYNVVGLTLSGRTVGKYLCGLRVADDQGRPLGPGAALTREGLKLLSLAALGLGYLPALLPGQRTLHDTFADAQVFHEA